MASSATSLRLAHAIGFGSGAWLAGSIASISIITIPTMQVSKTEDGVDSTTLARQWTILFNKGKAAAPPFAAAAASAYAYLAWSSRNLPSRHRLLLYSASAALTVGIVPFTLVFMDDTNTKLAKHALYSKKEPQSSSADKLEDTDIDRLITKWGWLNLTRSLLPVAGCVLALAAL